jgi:protoporphyrinogen oxidase
MEREMIDADLLVIGAGISGASLAAQAARSGLHVAVLEGEATSGGCLQSLRPEPGFWLELGAHTCYSSYQALLALLGPQGPQALLRRARVPFRVLRAGQIRPIWRELRVLELLRSAPRVAWTKQHGETVASYYSRIVGPHNYAHLFSKLFAAVPSQDADGFPAELLFKRRPRRKDVPRSFTVEGGLQTMVTQLLGEARILLETRFFATALRRSGPGFVVQAADGRSAQAPRLAVALPPSRAATLLAEAYPEIAATLGRIRTVQVDSVGFVLHRHAVSAAPLAGLIPLDDPLLCSIVSRDVVPHRTLRGFTAHFRPGLEADQRLARACTALNIRASQVQHVAHRSVLMPAPARGHAAIAAELDRLICGTPLSLAGNYFGGLSIEDCVRRAAAEATRLCAFAAARAQPDAPGSTRST